jgi:hypothetical protein
MRIRSTRRVARFISEFVVIVVGVLAALSVDSWRQNRIDRGLERDYVGQIIADSHENQRLIAEAITLEQKHLDVVERLLQAARQDTPLSADSVGTWLDRRDGSWWYSDPRLLDGTVTALVLTGDFGLIRDARARSAILGYVSQLKADLEEFRRGIQKGSDAITRLADRGEMQLTPDLAPSSPREVRLYLAIVRDPEGRAALARLRAAYESRIWYLSQIQEATAVLLVSLS